MAPLQNACLQDQEWLSVWWKVLIRTSSGWWTAGQKVSKEWWQKCCGYAEEGKIGKKENQLPTNVTIDRGKPGKRSDKKVGTKFIETSNHLMHDIWVAYFRTWRRRSLFSGRALTCRSRSSVWSFTKAIARHTKIRRKVPAKQRGSWPKNVFKLKGAWKKQHSSHLRKIGACLHQTLKTWGNEN